MNRNISLPLDLSFVVNKRDWGNVFREFQNIRQTIIAYGDVVYRNFTIVVPWTDRVKIDVSAMHSWDDKPWNNIASVEIYVFPDAKISAEPLLPMTSEGYEIKLRVKITSNVMEEGYTIALAVRDNSTDQQLDFREVAQMPRYLQSHYCQ